MRAFLLQVGLAAAVANAAPESVHENSSSASGSTYWYANVRHNGANAPFTSNWTVFRNVLNYGAIGDGKTDDTAAIRNAITLGNDEAARGSGHWGSTGQPAVVFFPPGTYLVNDTIRNYIGTVLMGDPTNRPTIKASATFKASTLLHGPDHIFLGLVGFYHEIKNLVFDTTALPATSTVTLVDWGVSQACQLSNSVFMMPKGATGHTAIAARGMSSPLLLNDLKISGGGVGYTGASTQYHLKNIHFRGVRTAIRPTNMVHLMIQACRFEDVATGVDMSGGTLGQLTIIDSTATNTPVLVNTDANQRAALGSIVLENIVVDSTVPATVRVGNSTFLTGSVTRGDTWIRGNVYSGNSASGRPQPSVGQKFSTSRPSSLVNETGAYYTVQPPTYADFTIDQVVNVREVAAYSVKGDGTTDDTKSLQAILTEAANSNKIAYFPHGTYIITDTLTIPPGSRLWGESFTELSGSGPLFKDIDNPKTVIKVGEEGDVGIAQFTDLVFTVQDVLPGAVLLEVNMAGLKPGDVGFFNTHFRFGGARGTKTNQCEKIEDCRAVHIAAHLTKSSSSYWENSWAWVADHDLDSGGSEFGAYPSPAGGFLIEARKGTWMLGWGVEHFVLYQVTIRDAENVFVGIQQGEAAYYQGVGNTLLAPSPWENNLLASDPDFAWCNRNASSCRMSIYQRVTNSSSVNLYNGGYWNFVAGPNRTFCSTDCQDNAVFYENNSKLFSYGITAINNANLVVETGPADNRYVAIATHADNEGIIKDVFNSGVVAAYLRQSGE